METGKEMSNIYMDSKKIAQVLLSYNIELWGRLKQNKTRKYLSRIEKILLLQNYASMRQRFYQLTHSYLKTSKRHYLIVTVVMTAR